MVKFDNDGVKQWAKNFGGPDNDIFKSVTAVSGGFITVGYSGLGPSGSNGDFDSEVSGKGAWDATIVKFDNNGVKQWAKGFGGDSMDDFKSVTEVPGGFVAVGISGSTSFVGTNDFDPGVQCKGDADAIIVKYDNNGVKQWAKNFGGPSSDYFQSVTTVPGGFVAVGYSGTGSFGGTNDFDPGVGPRGREDATIVKFDNDGNKQWAKNFGGPGQDLFFSVTATTGRIIAVGFSDSDSFIGTNDFDTGMTAKSGRDATFAIFDNSPFVPVTNITGVPLSAIAGTDLSLTGAVTPAGATNKTITWSVKDPGTTGATISGSKLSTTAAGTAEITATVADGTAVGTPFKKDFTITVSGSGSGGTFVAVTDITGVPDSAVAGTDLILSGTVIPTNATNKTVSWSVKDPGATGATITNGKLATTSAGTAIITATIANGSASGTPFMKDFSITVSASGTTDETESSGSSSLLWIALITVVALVLIALYYLYSKGVLQNKNK